MGKGSQGQSEFLVDDWLIRWLADLEVLGWWTGDSAVLACLNKITGYFPTRIHFCPAFPWPWDCKVTNTNHKPEIWDSPAPPLSPHHPVSRIPRNVPNYVTELTPNQQHETSRPCNKHRKSNLKTKWNLEMHMQRRQASLASRLVLTKISDLRGTFDC